MCVSHSSLPAGLEINEAVIYATSPASGEPVLSAALEAPALSSRPGAPARLFLDFDGDLTPSWGSYAPGTTPAYDVDGDATTFTATELANIRAIWERVAEKFSPFNLDVTTIDPGTLADRQSAKVVFGGTGGWLGVAAGGVAYVGGFFNSAPNNVFVFTKNLGNGHAKYAAEAGAHEAGHVFGLQHQATYSGTTLVKEYNTGNSLVAPIMGTSYNSARGLWWIGPTPQGSTRIQDDMAVLASSGNAFGYRADDFGGTIAAASGMTVAGSSLSAGGVIERISDADVFSFTTSGGSYSLRADVALGAMLDLKMDLRRSDGTIISSADTSALGESLGGTLSAGTYFVTIASHGGQGDVGQYKLTGTFSSAPPVQLLAPTNYSVTPVSATQVNVSWQDHSTGETGYRVMRTSNGGATWTSFFLPPDATSYVDTGVSPGTTYQYRVLAYSPTQYGPSVDTVITTVPLAPANLIASAISNSQIDLNWDDVTGESSYVIERSLDGLNWNPAGTTGSGVVTFQDNGLAAGTTYHYRVLASNSGGLSQVSGEVIATTQSVISGKPLAPSNFDAIAVSSTAARLNWADNSANEAGFQVFYSTNGTSWVLAGKVARNVTTMDVTGLTPAALYYFRVRAYNIHGNSSAIVISLTMPQGI